MQLQFTLEDNLWWTTTAVFPSWRVFQGKSGTYGGQDCATPFDGSYRIVFAPEGRGNEPLTDSEKSSIAWTIENEVSMSKALMLSLLKEYPSLQKQYGYSRQEKAVLMPDVISTEDLRALVGLQAVNVHPVQRDGIPYVGFEFGCTWDNEHGLGVLMHGTRTVEIGGADTAILLWIAEQDAEKP